MPAQVSPTGPLTGAGAVADAPPRNIVLCLDGTGNLFGHEKTSVIKLFQVCQRDERQRVYYDPGVGTLGDAGYKTSIGRGLNKALGGAIGVGLMKNVEEACSYLMENHQAGDRVFIFGFSRGAYTARVLAGFINRCGLFEKGCQNLIPYALRMFLEPSPPAEDVEAVKAYHAVRSSFRRTYGRRFTDAAGQPTLQTPIHFLGLWDTVKSYGWLYDPVRIPGEEKNESVHTVRHAIALDEQRVFFPQMHWQRKGADQDAREVWFAGVHQDVGGGYAEDESGLSKIPLAWMLGQACDAGLRVVDTECAHIVFGAPDVDRTRRDKQPPDPAGVRHLSLRGPWRVAEGLPWRRPDHRMCWRPRLAGDRARTMPACSVVHRSVLLRMLQPADALAPGVPPARGRYQPAQWPRWDDGALQALVDGQPRLLAADGGWPARLWLPLDTAAARHHAWEGQVLVLALGADDHRVLAEGGRGDTPTTVGRLALRCSQALLVALPAQPQALEQPAIDRYRDLAGKLPALMNAYLSDPRPRTVDRTMAALNRLHNAGALAAATRQAMLAACGHLLQALVTVVAWQAGRPGQPAVALAA